MRRLFIAEKPSVAQDIVRALTPVAGKFEKHADHFENERYVVTSAVGHLVEITAPDEYEVKRGKWSFAHLPVIPPRFDLAPIDKAKTRLNVADVLVHPEPAFIDGHVARVGPVGDVHVVVGEHRLDRVAQQMVHRKALAREANRRRGDKHPGARSPSPGKRAAPR